MGEDQGAVRAGGVGEPLEPPEPRDPAQVRADIEDTREQLGDTVAALAEKTDVKARAREKVAGVRQTVADKTAQLKGGGSDGAPSGAPGSGLDSGSGSGSGSGGAGEAVAQVRAKAEQNPVVTAAIAAFAGGLVFGRLSKRG